MNRSLRLLSCLLILWSTTGCNRYEIASESSKTANETLFNHDQTATATWNPEAAAPLNKPEITRYTESILKKLSAQAKYPGRYTLEVTNDALVNGGSFPSGKIVITRGMLNSAFNEAEIAGYIGHEIGHQDLNHMKRMTEDSFMKRAVNRGLDYAAQVSGTPYEASGQVKDMVTTGYGRAMEQEADEYGAVLAAKAGYNPYGLADLFDRLAGRVNKGFTYRIAKLKGSHKALDARAKHLRGYLAKKGYGPKGESNPAGYQSVLSSLQTYGGRKPNSEKAPAESYKEVETLTSELAAYKTSKKPIPVVRWIQIMQRLSSLRQSYGMPLKIGLIRGSSSYLGFMEEAVTQDEPLFGNQGDPDFSGKVDLAANLAAHLEVGAFPPSALAGFGYEALTGNDFYTGQPIGLAQRALSAVAAIASFADASDGVMAFKESVASAESAGVLSASSAEEGAQAAQAASQMLPQIEADSVLLGENMAGRVRPSAEALGADVYEPAVPNGPGAIEANQQWLSDRISLGNPVYDIDADPARMTRSPFYQMEQQTLTDAGLQRQYVGDIPAPGGADASQTIKLYKWVKS